jgi:aspartate beta-hydroxylase
LQPFWDIQSDPDNFPWANQLQNNAHIIINEFQQNLLLNDPSNNNTNDNNQGLFSGDSAWQSAIMGKGWSAFRLQRLGVWNVANCKVFPQTYELLRELNIPLAVRGVCFARQEGGSGVGVHSDGRNFILTSHLGLKIPEGEILLERVLKGLFYHGYQLMSCF